MYVKRVLALGLALAAALFAAAGCSDVSYRATDDVLSAAQANGFEPYERSVGFEDSTYNVGTIQVDFGAGRDTHKTRIWFQRNSNGSWEFGCMDTSTRRVVDFDDSAKLRELFNIHFECPAVWPL